MCDYYEVNIEVDNNMIVTKRIIYKNSQGGVSVEIPAPEYLASHTIEELVARVVPENEPYKIVDASEIPSDRTFRNAWEYSE